MAIRGKVVLNEKGLTGVKVILLKNGTKIDQALTTSNGKYIFPELTITPEGDVYIVHISKPGHISIKHWVSTKAPDDRKILFPDYFPEVELFRVVQEVEREKALSAILEEPISKFAYSVSKGDFADDRAYFSTIKARVNQLFEILDAEERERKRLLDEYRSKQKLVEIVVVEEEAVEDQKSSFEKALEEVLDHADQLLDKKKYRQAMSGYKEAMSLVSKSGLPKTERDKLKKRPKRKIYDLETVMAGLTEEELDALENEADVMEEAVEEVAVEALKESKDEAEEEEVAVVEAAEVEMGEEVVVEPLSEREMAKREAEMSITNALVQRDQILTEKVEEVRLKRKETLETAALKTMKSNAVVKQHEVATSRENKAEEVKINKNKEIVALRSTAMRTMIAYSKKKTVAVSKEAAPTEEVEKRPETRPKAERPSSVAVAEKDKKDLKGAVVIIRNRIKVTDLTKKPATPEKAEAKVQKYKPKSFQFKEESMYKTVTNTVIKYPVRQDTFQHVEYVWGFDYYFKNNVEIDEATYNKALNSLKQTQLLQ